MVRNVTFWFGTIYIVQKKKICYWGRWVNVEDSYFIRNGVVTAPKNIKMFVLDEADEMLSRGFKDQIYEIFQKLPSSTQVIPPSLNFLIHLVKKM